MVRKETLVNHELKKASQALKAKRAFPSPHIRAHESVPKPVVSLAGKGASSVVKKSTLINPVLLKVAKSIFTGQYAPTASNPEGLAKVTTHGY